MKFDLRSVLFLFAAVLSSFSVISCSGDSPVESGGEIRLEEEVHIIADANVLYDILDNKSRYEVMLTEEGALDTGAGHYFQIFLRFYGETDPQYRSESLPEGEFQIGDNENPEMGYESANITAYYGIATSFTDWETFPVTEGTLKVTRIQRNRYTIELSGEFYDGSPIEVTYSGKVNALPGIV